jgi:putative solute:sodium symporter small subunit
MAPMPDPNADTYWYRTRRLMLVALGLWIVLAVVLPLFVVPLNRIIVPFLDLPLGFLMAAQGTLIVLIAVLFWFARRQDRIDRDHFIVDGDG